MTPPRLDEGSEREAFEAWLPEFWTRQTFTDDEGDKIYCQDWVQGAWVGWCAALSTGRLGGEAEWPTKEMVAAGLRRMLSDKQYSAAWEDVIYNMFRDMLAAAPAETPPAAGAIDAREQELPSHAELLALYRRCEQMAGGLGMLYYNYAREVFSLASRQEAPAASEQEAPKGVHCRRCNMLGRDFDSEGKPRCTYCGIAYPDGQAPAAAGAAQAVAGWTVTKTDDGDYLLKHGTRGHVICRCDDKHMFKFLFEFLNALAATPAPETKGGA